MWWVEVRKRMGRRFTKSGLEEAAGGPLEACRRFRFFRAPHDKSVRGDVSSSGLVPIYIVMAVCGTNEYIVGSFNLRYTYTY